MNVTGAERIEAVELEDTVTGARSLLPVSGLFIAIGHSPATDFLRSSGIALDEKGYIALSTRSCATNFDGVLRQAMSQMRIIDKRSLQREWDVKQRSNPSDGFRLKACIDRKTYAGVTVLLTLSSRS